MSLAVFASRRFADHVTPAGHPEAPERAAVMHAAAAAFAQSGGDVREGRMATDEELTRVHDAAYVATLRSTAGRAVALDGDTVTSPQSVDVASLAAGSALAAVEAVLDPEDPARRALVLVRPPGHHAERDRAMGFCLFNNVALAAAHARARGLTRVAIVDFDVHHGNGTQWSFYEDPSVLFISSHQFPYYPGTGAASEIGSGSGRGYTVNLPLDAGAGDADFDLVYSRVVVPVLTEYRPELLLVSAGFDAHRDDPLGGCQVSTPQFGRLVRMLAGVADTCCQGRLVAVTEGGYDLQAFGECLRTTIEALSGSSTQVDAAPGGAAPRGEAALAAIRPHLSGTWTL